MTKTHPDKAVIAALGGPAELARGLGLPIVGGVQRVQNWTTRGIPAAVRLKHFSLFAEAERRVKEAKSKRKAAA